MMLPPLDANKAHFPRKLVTLTDKHKMRKLSALVMPKRGECTLLPGLSSVDGLLQTDVDAIADKEVQILRTASQLTILSSPTVHNASASQASSSCWHIVLLRRTFRDTTLQDVALALNDVLELEPHDALQKATSGQSATTLVVSTHADCKVASEKAQSLRSKGLLVQVASAVGLPSSQPEAAETHPTPLSPVSPLSTISPKTPKAMLLALTKPTGNRPEGRMGRRRSCGDVFREATKGHSPTMHSGKIESDRSKPMAQDRAQTTHWDCRKAQDDTKPKLPSPRPSPRHDGSPRPQQPRRRRLSCPSTMSDPALGEVCDIIQREMAANETAQDEIISPRLPALAKMPPHLHIEMTSQVSEKVVVEDSCNRDGFLNHQRTVNAGYLRGAAPPPASPKLDSPKMPAPFAPLCDGALGTLDPEASEKMVTPSRREASALLRFLTFGDIPQDLSKQPRQDTIGTK